MRIFEAAKRWIEERKKYDAVVVIPSTQEGGGIRFPLETIKTQRDIEKKKVLVLVVINNARGAVKAILESNEATADMVKEFAQEMPPNIHVEEVDMWRGDNAPEKTSFSLARHRGHEEALKRVKKNGVVINTDADSGLHPHNIAYTLEEFSWDPELGYLTGPVFIGEDLHDEKINRAKMHVAAGWDYKKLIEETFDTFQSPFRDLILFNMSGAHLSIRAAALRQIHELGPCEDWLLANRVVLAGYDGRYVDEIKVTTSPRISERVQYGVGRAVEHALKDEKPFCEMEVREPHYIMFTRAFVFFLDTLRDETNQEVWEKRVIEYVESSQHFTLHHKTLKTLWKLVNMPDKKNMPTFHNDPEVVFEVKKICAPHFRKVPLHVGLRETYDLLAQCSGGRFLVGHEENSPENRGLHNRLLHIFAHITEESTYMALFLLLSIMFVKSHYRNVVQSVERLKAAIPADHQMQEWLDLILLTVDRKMLHEVKEVEKFAAREGKDWLKRPPSWTVTLESMCWHHSRDLAVSTVNPIYQGRAKAHISEQNPLADFVNDPALENARDLIIETMQALSQANLKLRKVLGVL